MIAVCIKKLCKTILIVVVLAMPPLCFPQNKPLRLISFEYHPFVTRIENSAQGMSVEIVKEIFLRMGREITIEIFPVARALRMFENGDVDAFFTIKKTPERETKFLFPKEALITQDYVFFAPNDSKLTFDGDLSSLSNASIGVVNQVTYGSRFDTAVKNGVFKRLESAPSFELTFKKLLGGRMDTVIASRVVGIAFLNEIGGLNKIKIIGTPVETTESYLAFSRKEGCVELANAFDRTVAAMRKDGTFSRIVKKYEQQ